MKILIETVPHSEQRYPTVGDWQWKRGTGPAGFEGLGEERDTLHIRVSAMSDWRYEALVGIHEAIEALLCKEAGVTEQQVDQFDLNHSGPGEPGDDPLAPYKRHHESATYVEKFLAHELGVDWKAYESEVDSL